MTWCKVCMWSADTVTDKHLGCLLQLNETEQTRETQMAMNWINRYRYKRGNASQHTAVVCTAHDTAAQHTSWTIIFNMNIRTQTKHQLSFSWLTRHAGCLGDSQEWWLMWQHTELSSDTLSTIHSVLSCSQNQMCNCMMCIAGLFTCINTTNKFLPHLSYFQYGWN